MIEEPRFQSDFYAICGFGIQDLFALEKFADAEVDRGRFEGIAVVHVEAHRVLLLLP